MAATKTLLVLFFIKTSLANNLDGLFENINKELAIFNANGSAIAWECSIHPSNTDLSEISENFQRKRIPWEQQTCRKLGVLFHRQLLNETQRRMAFLLCRGPKYTLEELGSTSSHVECLRRIYSDAEICIPNDNNAAMTNMSSVEEAILNFLSNVKQLTSFGESDYINLAAKIAVNNQHEELSSLCLLGENDFEKMMAFSRKEEVLRWLWLVWREKVGPPMKEPYRELVEGENLTVMRNGYPNIGAAWRDELEMPGLRKHCRYLYNSVKRFYMLLHGVVRYYLRRYYGDVVPKRGLIPAHLLGNLWSQNWEPLTDMILPKNIDLDKSIKKMNWTVKHMVRRAEDFYQSMGLPAMTDKFWEDSVFSKENNSDVRCHGTAADLYQDGDYRLLYCADISKEDFYVLHHELGHIHYYMAYAHQPAIFRQANSAFHETVGDTVMYGVLTPQHLNRLGLINDSMLYTTNIDKNTNEQLHENTKENAINAELEETSDENRDLDDEDKMTIEEKIDLKETNPKYKYINDVFRLNNKKRRNKRMKNQKYKLPELLKPEELTTDMILLLHQALNKIPQIPFALVVDEYRWAYFEGSIQPEEENKRFWDLVIELQGVGPVGERGEEYFDVGAKYHVPDSTPYIRYFLSSFLQHQLFEKLCKAAVYGHHNVDKPVPETISFTRCDIYGSKAAGKVLRDFMSRGHSQHWSEILQATTGQSEVSASSLLRYYRPLYKVLENFVLRYQIPIGW